MQQEDVHVSDKMEDHWQLEHLTIATTRLLTDNHIITLLQTISAQQLV